MPKPAPSPARKPSGACGWRRSSSICCASGAPNAKAGPRRSTKCAPAAFPVSAAICRCSILERCSQDIGCPFGPSSRRGPNHCRRRLSARPPRRQPCRL